MRDAGLEFYREIEQEIYYKDKTLGTRRADFVVMDKVLVEMKAIEALQNVHLVQTLNYLKAYHLEVALLINFGAANLTFKRLIFSKSVTPPLV